MFLQLNNPLQHAKATVQDHHITTGKDGLQHMKQQSNNFSDGESFPSTSSIYQRFLWYKNDKFEFDDELKMNFEIF